MISKPKIILSAVIMALSSASPVLAQSLNPGDGTGNTLPMYYGPDRSKHFGVPPNAAAQQPLYNYAPLAPNPRSHHKEARGGRPQ